jgi:hypothetical protein
MNDADYRKSFVVKYFDIADGQLENADVDFWNVEGYPVVNVYDGKTGMIALDDPVRTVPMDGVYRNGWELNRGEFLNTFPQTLRYFQAPAK